MSKNPIFTFQNLRSNKSGVSSVLMAMVLEWAQMGVMVSCANTFGHIVFNIFAQHNPVAIGLFFLFMWK